MFKKLMVVFCVIALALSVFCVVSAEQSSGETFKAGYAMVDINPYWSVWAKASGEGIPYGYQEDNIMPLPMDGYSNGLDRLAEPTLTDDNGDGVVGQGDGLQATCIALQDGKQTLLLIAVDMLRIDDVWGNAARECISSATGIPVSNIMLSASHTHGGVNMDVKFKDEILTNRYTADGVTYTGAQIGAYRDAYVEHVKEQLKKLARDAIVDAVEVTAQRGTINANTQSGQEMNGVRHYKLTDDDGVEYVAGPNFNGSVKKGETPVSEGNQQLHVLKFVPENGGEPIVLVNWRAHTNTGSKRGNHYLTSDHVGSMRKTLSDNGYRASFYLGAAGNHGNFNGVNETDAWYYAPDYAQRSVNYGRTLAEVALALLENKNVVDGAMVAEMADVATGEIRVNHIAGYRFDGNHVNAVQLAAAQAHNSNSGCSNSGRYPCVHTVTVEDKSEQYVIASKYHADTIITRADYKPADSWGVTGEINVLTIGSELAFVTAPFELFDRYSATATLDNTEANDWDTLANLGYGTPFVFTCTNEHWGYVSNQLGFNYNTGSEHYGKYAAGCYEAQTGYLAEGSGEQLIKVYEQMLSYMPEKTGTCVACGGANAHWVCLTEEYLEKMSNQLTDGHYYLDSNLEINAAITVIGANVCLDLNGHSITATGTGRTCSVYAGKTLSVMDTSENHSGEIKGSEACSENLGGNFYVLGTLNLYGGTITGGHATSFGGNIQVQGGTFNMYGGEIINGSAANGPNLLVSRSPVGTFRFAGGYIDGDTHIMGHLILGGNATTTVDKVTQLKVTNDLYTVTLDGLFTGKVSLTYSNGGSGNYTSTNRGSATDYSSIHPNAELKVGSNYLAVDENNVLIEVNTKPALAATWRYDHGDGADRAVYYYTTNNSKIAQIAGSTAKNPVVLQLEIESLTLSQDMYMNLNGCSVMEVTENAYTLYCKDSVTDNFDATEGWGTAPKQANVVALNDYRKVATTDEMNRDSVLYGTKYYLAMDEANGRQSFHRLEMLIKTMIVNIDTKGISYEASFQGDKKIQDNIQEFGIAMRAYNVPNETYIWADTEMKAHEAKTADDWTGNPIRGVDVVHILTDDPSNSANKERADVKIYGSCYIRFTDGTMLFSPELGKSFNDVVKDMDTLWNDFQGKESFLEFYNKYAAVLKTDDLENIPAEQ